MYENIIIGAGVAGLVAAYEYEKKYPNKKGLIIDANCYVGGRMHVVTIGKDNISTGAGVVRESDKHIINLINELGLTLDSFNSVYEIHGKDLHEGYDTMRNDFLKFIKGLYEKNPDIRNESMAKIFSVHVNHEYISKIKKYAEYNDYDNYTFHDFINYYPVEDFLPERIRKRYVVRGGWDLFLKTLVGKLKNHEIILNEKVREIGTSYVTTTRKYETRNLIVACDLDMKKIKFNGISVDFLKGYGSVNFLKVFTLHDSVTGINYKRFPDSPLTKVIKMSNNVLMSCYSQNSEAKTLFDMLNSDKELNQTMDKIYRLAGIELPPCQKTVVRYWRHGVHYHIGERIDVIEMKKRTGIIFVGEMVSDHQGWVEGAVESVLKVVDML